MDFDIISVSNVCMEGIRLCLLPAFLWYCCHSHFSLVVGMVARYLPVSSKRWVISFCVCIVFFMVVMFFSGLYSVILIWVCGIILGGGINLVSLFCIGI